jgi:putative membrane protein
MRVLLNSALAIALGLATVPCRAELTGLDRDFANDAFRLNVSAIQDAQWGNRSDQPEAVKLVAQRIIKDHAAALSRLKQIALDKNIKLPAMPMEDQQHARDDLKKQDADALRVNYLRRQVEQRQQEVSLCERELKEGTDENLRLYCGDNLPNLHEQIAMAKSAEAKP